MLRFARVCYSKSYDQIPSRLGILKKNECIWDYYVKKFNPIVTERVNINGCEGFDVRLPLLEDEVGEKAEIVKEKTLKWLCENDVGIMKWQGIKSDCIKSADGKNIMPYFIRQAFLKAADMQDIAMEKAEAVIIDGNTDYTKAIIMEICNSINYITVLVEGENRYREFAREIFENTGLEIAVAGFSKEILKYGDFIINNSEWDFECDYLYKKNSVYINLGSDTKRLSEIIRKRRDMIIADGFKLKLKDGYTTAEELDLYMYMTSSSYRSARGDSFDWNTHERVREYILGEQLDFVALTQYGKVIKAKKY